MAAVLKYSARIWVNFLPEYGAIGGRNTIYKVIANLKEEKCKNTVLGDFTPLQLLNCSGTSKV